MEKKAAPYGSWKSPITADRVAMGTLKLSEIRVCEGKVYWLERRPLENARCTLVCWSPEQGEKELLPKEYNIRSKVHEYGGGALLVQKEGIYFVNHADQQIYRVMPEGKVEQITRQENARFTDGVIH
ncbi:MAG: S9 family peptidase, partial [Nitrososphaerales archaeon]